MITNSKSFHNDAKVILQEIKFYKENVIEKVNFKDMKKRFNINKEKFTPIGSPTVTQDSGLIDVFLLV